MFINYLLHAKPSSRSLGYTRVQERHHPYTLQPHSVCVLWGGQKQLNRQVGCTDQDPRAQRGLHREKRVRTLHLSFLLNEMGLIVTACLDAMRID